MEISYLWGGIAKRMGLNRDYNDDLDKEDLQRQTQRIKDVYTLILEIKGE